MTKIFQNRNEAANKREEFFKGIEKMVTEFSKNDIERLRTIVFNEIRSRRQVKDESRGRITVVSSLPRKS